MILPGIATDSHLREDSGKKQAELHRTKAQL